MASAATIVHCVLLLLMFSLVSAISLFAQFPSPLLITGVMSSLAPSLGYHTSFGGDSMTDDDPTMLFKSNLFRNNWRQKRNSVADGRLLNVRFVDEPTERVVARGGHATFDCRVRTDVTGVDIRTDWRRDGAPIGTHANRISVHSNGTLLIESVQPSDEGVYQCVVATTLRDDTWTYVSRNARLIVSVLPRFTEQPSDQTVEAGQTAVFHCTVDAVPTPTIEWFKDDKLIDPVSSPRLTIYPVSGSLEIRAAQPGDQGSYHCQATNPGKDRISKAGRFTVTSRTTEHADPTSPVFVTEPSGQVVKEGDTLVFECASNGYPAPAITWLRNKETLHLSSDDRLSTVGQGTLVIRKASAEHAGSYTCRAENTEDASDATALLRVQTMPKLVSGPQNRVAKETVDVEFDCRADGQPGPAITWYKNGEVIITSEYFVIEGSKLKVLGLVKTDQAVYQCVVENGAGSVQAAAQLLVETADERHRPRFGHQQSPSTGVGVETNYRPTSSPSADDQPERVSAEPRMTVETIDRSSSTKEVTIVMEPDLPPGFHEATDHSDSTADNNSGGVSEAAPSEPLALKKLAAASRYLTISWEPPFRTNGQILTYGIFYKESQSARERAFNSTDRQATVDNLRPNTVYSIRVVAYNEFGQGTTSTTLQVTTDSEKAVPGMVRNLRGLALSATSIEIEWEPPTADLNDGFATTVKHYRLFYRKTDPPQIDEEDNERNEDEDNDDWFGSSSEETEIQVSPTRYVLHGLDKWTRYSFRVEAFGEHGAGLTSDTLILSTHSDAPSAPPNDVQAEAVSSTELMVQWRPPPIGERNGELTGYKVKYRRRQRGSRSLTLVTDGTTMERVIDTLQPGTHYQVRVAAITRNGTGPFCEWIHLQTYLHDREEHQVPGPPTRLRVQPHNTNIKISWTPPLDNGIVIRGYMIGWGISVPDITKAKVDANQRYWDIKNLRPNRDYVISLRAYNKKGPGFPIYETVRTMDPRNRGAFPGSGGENGVGPVGPLTTPHPVRALTRSATSVHLTWSNGGRSQVPRDGRVHEVRYRNIHDGGFVYMNVSETETLVEGLRPNTRYQFNVRVAHGGSASEWSMDAENKTLSAKPTSAPRDFTAARPRPPHGDPLAVLLNWQPPRYPNGQIIEYLIFYTDNTALEDGQWKLEAVAGDQLSTIVENLLPKTEYSFKIQVRNEIGYGPFTSLLNYSTATGFASGPHDGRRSTARGADGGDTKEGESPEAHIILGIGAAVALFALLLLLCVAIWCCCRHRSGRHHKSGYVAGTRAAAGGGKEKPPPDLWIDHDHRYNANSGNQASPGASMQDLKQVVHSPHPAPLADTPRYHSLADGDQGAMTRSVVGANAASMHNSSKMVGRAKPIMIVNRHGSVGAAAGNAISSRAEEQRLTPTDRSSTLSKSYHQSASLERNPQSGRHRPTPQVVYTGPTKGGARVELLDNSRNSPYGSDMITPTPPPLVPNGNPPPYPGGDSPIPGGGSHYGTLPNRSSANPLKSFSTIAPPPAHSPAAELLDRTNSGRQPQPVHRPTVVGAGSPAQMHSPYHPHQSISSGGKPGAAVVGTRQQPSTYTQQPMSARNPMVKELVAETELPHSFSTEELNVQMQSLDTMIDDLQAMQKEFGAV